MNQETSHLDVLRAEFQVRISKNAKYSLRAFARDLGLSPASVSQVFNGKKGLSAKTAAQIARKLGLNPRESEYLVQSVVASHGRSEKNRTEAEASLKKLKQKVESTKTFLSEEMKVANRWHHLAIMELLELRSRQNDPQWFAKKLGMNIVLVKRALQELEDIGWIKKENNVYHATYFQATTAFDIPSASIRALHSDLLAKANEALHTQNIDEREFLNMTLSFKTKDLADAKKSIREFQSQFSEKYYDANAAKDAVYQLSIQFFRIDKKDGSNV